MLMLLALPEFSLEILPKILLVALAIVLFCAILWLILGKLPAAAQGWAKWIALVVGGILLLWFLISLV